MENKKELNEVLIAKTSKVIKVFVPIISVAAIALFLVIGIIEGDSILLYFFIGLSIFLLVLCIFSFTIPAKAIVYDKDRKVLVIRAGKTSFTAYKRRYVYLDEIMNVIGIASNTKVAFLGVAYVVSSNTNAGLHLFIKGKSKPMSLSTVSKPVKVAEEINALLAEHCGPKEGPQNPFEELE